MLGGLSHHMWPGSEFSGQPCECQGFNLGWVPSGSISVAPARLGFVLFCFIMKSSFIEIHLERCEGREGKKHMFPREQSYPEKK